MRAVRRVSLAVAPGETLGLVGESGSGKSTVGRIAVGLDRPDAGGVMIGGVATTRLSAARRRARFRCCQMIFQDPYSSLNPRLSVGRQVAEGLFATGLRDWREIRRQVGALFATVGLNESHLDRYPHEFSGGQRQRIAIARALAPRPALVVADEPVSALDVTIRAQILDLLADVQARERLAYLFISHDIAVVAHLCQHIAVMHRGRIVERGPTADIIERAAHPYTKALLDAVPRLGRRRTGARAAAITLPDHADDDEFVMVSAGHAVLAPAGT